MNPKVEKQLEAKLKKAGIELDSSWFQINLRSWVATAHYISPYQEIVLSFIGLGNKLDPAYDFLAVAEFKKQINL